MHDVGFLKMHVTILSSGKEVSTDERCMHCAHLAPLFSNIFLLIYGARCESECEMQFLAAKFIIPFVKSTQKQFSTTCVKDASFLQSILIKKTNGNRREFNFRRMRKCTCSYIYIK